MITAAALDFMGVIHSGRAPLYPQFGRPGKWIVFPHALTIGQRHDGTPDLRVDLVRAREANRGELVGYGYVDFRVVPEIDLVSATAAAGGGEVSPVDFEGGWLRLMVRESADVDAKVLLPPVRVASNGLGAVRLAARLTAEGVALFKRALLGGAVLIDAWAEMEVSGISPRLPLVVELRGSDLASALPLGRGLPVMRESVVNALAMTESLLGALPPGVDRLLVAEAVADRLRNLYGTFVPSPGDQVAEWWRLELPAGETHVRLDLGEKVTALRVMTMRFDPVAMVRDALESGGLERLIDERELPEFESGFVPLLVSANLPRQRSPVLSCGVDLTADPVPPHRMHVLRETVEFLPPDDRGEVLLRFAAGELATYTCETFVMLGTDSRVIELRSPRRPHAGSSTWFTVSDFALDWIPVAASAQLLREGAVTVAARWAGQAQTVSLTEDHPRDTLAIPAGVEGVELELALRRGGRRLRVPVQRGEHALLGLPMFREFGPHSVEISVDFAGGPDFVALDVKPEDEPDSAAVTVSFSRARPARTWNWFAPSPFAPGYRYRLFQSAAPSGRWSEPQSAFEALRLAARALTGTGSQAKT